MTFNKFGILFTIEGHMENIHLLAKKALENHQVIAFPTETVFGLGVYYDDEDAYHLLNQIKRRREDKPYTLMLSDIRDINKYAYIEDNVLKALSKFIPGPITLLLRCKDNVPGYVTHNTGVIGVRVPENKEALDLLKYLGKPLLVPSANRADQKPAMNDEEVKAIFNDEVKVIIPGKSVGGLPSTIIDLTGSEIKLIRQGPISLEDIKKAL